MRDSNMGGHRSTSKRNKQAKRKRSRIKNEIRKKRATQKHSNIATYNTSSVGVVALVKTQKRHDKKSYSYHIKSAFYTGCNNNQTTLTECQWDVIVSVLRGKCGSTVYW